MQLLWASRATGRRCCLLYTAIVDKSAKSRGRIRWSCLYYVVLYPKMAFKFMAGFNLLICGTCCWWNNGNLKFFFLYNFIGFIDSWILIKLMDNFTDWYVVYIAAVSLQYRDFTRHRTLLDFIKKYSCVRCGLNIYKTCLKCHNLACISMKENLWNCIKQRKERKLMQ